jgi:type I restriction enzyme R subunit
MILKKDMSEDDIRTKYIIPALQQAGWDIHNQIREQVYFTNGRIFVKGNTTRRGERKFADIILYYKPNIPIAIIEVKKNTLAMAAGIQQGLDYALTLDLPVVFSTNGDGFVQHDRSGSSAQLETNLSLEAFPTPQEVWAKYQQYKGILTEQAANIAAHSYYFDATGREPRYYQQIAINRTVEAIAKGQNRVLLIMATGTGKTYTAFQIIYRLWKSSTKKRVLFLADRNALIDQTKRGDFKHFKDKMTVIRHKNIDKAYEIYLALYQGLTNYDEDTDAYKQFSPDFFDLIVVDECHRGSASEESAWRKILDYFKSATQIGMTATPKETDQISNIEYFGEPLYTYSLKQGIDDGFLAPYKVIRIGLNVDLESWRPKAGQVDRHGNAIEDRIYNIKDYDRNLVIGERTQMVAKQVMGYLRKTNVYDKTIVFCIDIEHATRMRQAIVNEAQELVLKNNKYVMKITGDDEEGKRELDNFINPEETYPVIATTSKLMTTGVDAQTCKLIVLDANIGSMTEFKQIIGRGTRINEAFGKTFFTIMDFRNVTDQFANPEFDGDPVMIKEVEDIDDWDENDEVEPDNADGDGEVSDENTPQPTPVEPIIIPPIPNVDDPEPRAKIYVAGVDVSVLNQRVLHLDTNGKLISESLRDYTKKSILKHFRSMDDFLSRWHEADKKSAIIEELEQQGVSFDNLKDGNTPTKPKH